MAVSKQRHFEILREVLAVAEEQRVVPLTEAAAVAGVDGAELRKLLAPVLYLEFHVHRTGDFVSVTDAFLLTEDDHLVLDAGHWLRNLRSKPPDPDTALRLFVAATTMQALATEPTPDLDGAARKLADHLQVVLRVPVQVPDALDVAQEAWRTGRSLRMRYLRDADDAPRAREVLPWRVFSRWGHWYVHGRDLDDTEPKYFRLDRVIDAQLGAVEFDPPEHDEIPDWFDLSAHAHTVRVRMREAALESLPAPHQLGDAVAVDDGRVELDITVHGERRYEHLLVCLPGDAEVLAPADAAERCRAHAARLLRAFVR